MKDYYEKENYDFAAPCDTCKHRFEKEDDPTCPCRHCVHYAR